jgi:hypothetical protein
MKNKLLAFFCAAVLLVTALPAAGALTGEQSRAADSLYTLGLLRGGGSGDDFALSAPATRAQAVSMLVRLAGRETAAQTDQWISGFRDVPAWAEKAVTYAAHQKWVSGLDERTFGSDRPVTANAYCTFLLRMLGYSDAKGDFTVSGAAVFARHIGLLSRTFEGTLSRGDLAEISLDALSFTYPGTQETVIGRLVSGGAVPRAAASALGLLDETLTARQIADRCSAAVFRIDGYQSELHIKSDVVSSNATGFFISSDGLAVTNFHSISDSIYAVATLSTGEQYEIERVLYFDADIDIAVVRVSTTSLRRDVTSGFSYLPLAGTSEVRTGDTVYAIGNPLGLGLSVSSGVVSDAARTVGGYTLPCILNTADISRGSSGGALLNEYGQVVGVTAGAYSLGNSMYLAVPVDPAMTADLTGAGVTLEQATKLAEAAEEAG